MSEANEFRVRPADKERAISYFDKVSHDYDNTVSWGILKIPRDRERKVVLEFAELNRPGTSLADVGCGAGFYSVLGKKNGMTVHSFDTSPGMVKKLSSLVDKSEVADIENMDTQTKYDTVICAGVLDFVLRPELAFKNLCRLVGPQGRLVVLCPRQGLGGLFYRIEKYFFGIRINLFQSHWLAKLAEQEGLILEAMKHPLPTNMALLFRKIR